MGVVSVYAFVANLKGLRQNFGITLLADRVMYKTDASVALNAPWASPGTAPSVEDQLI